MAENPELRLFRYFERETAARPEQTVDLSWENVRCEPGAAVHGILIAKIRAAAWL